MDVVGGVDNSMWWEVDAEDAQRIWWEEFVAKTLRLGHTVAPVLISTSSTDTIGNHCVRFLASALPPCRLSAL
jgi:hypothetical protein